MKTDSFSSGFIAIIVSGLMHLQLAGAIEVIWFETNTPWGTPKLRYQHYLNDGKRVKHGRAESYYLSGQLQGLNQYKHGKLHGEAKVFHEGLDGRLDTLYTYKNNLEHGNAAHYDPTGQLIFECLYNRGEPIEGRLPIVSSTASATFDKTNTFETIRFKDGEQVPNSQKTYSYTVYNPPVLDPPDFSKFIKWFYYSYDIESDYPHRESLPNYDQIPFLINWCKQGNGNDCSEIAKSQLRTLSRCDFSKSIDATDEWQKWWDHFGRVQEKNRELKGVHDAKAWEIASQNRQFALPKEPIYLPDNYQVRFTFTSGDYGAVTKEEMTLVRTPETATLKRIFSTKTNAPRTHQKWNGMTVQKADTITRAIVYIIDHPWLRLDEERINQEYQARRKSTPKAIQRLEQKGDPKEVQIQKIKHRESFSHYYPFPTFQIEDSEGRIIINDDPWSKYYGGNHDRFSSPEPVIGLSIIYPFFIKHFPESQISKAESTEGWINLE